MIVVSDASPLISLAVVKHLDLLRQLYKEVLIPNAVHQEIVASGVDLPGMSEIAAASWLHVSAVGDRLLVKQLSLQLDAGEAEAIALAIESSAELLLVDERRARAEATRLGCRVVGVLGVLLEAKMRGHLPFVRPVLDDLIEKAGFRVSSLLHEHILRAAGE